MDGLAYYATHGPLTEPGEHAGDFGKLPMDLGVFCQFVQGIVLLYLTTSPELSSSMYFSG